MTTTFDVPHYDDVTMGAIASQMTSLAIVYSAVYSVEDQRKHQGSASLAFVRGIHRGPVNSPHKWPVTRKMFPFVDVIMHKVYVWRSPQHTQQIDLMSVFSFSKSSHELIPGALSVKIGVGEGNRIPLVTSQCGFRLWLVAVRHYPILSQIYAVMGHRKATIKLIG